MSKLQKLELLKDSLQQAIDRAVSSIGQIHQQIADLPFELLERAGVMSEDKLALRERNRQAAAMVYDAIRRVNQQIGDLISDQIENLEDAQHVHRVLDENEAEERAAKAPAPKKAPAKKKPAAKKTAAKKAPAKAAPKKKPAARKK
ncbi:hypothetical protein [Solimonas sp. K1W22B-7]|uniref:hypothetical protein n=1 Tax=Solimonas sp. K1W22B-7 TaxID=2303331 RepID=UPI001968DC5D|nr:hypothetical protein [Solimonas sp. K1W22B-7]